MAFQKYIFENKIIAFSFKFFIFCHLSAYFQQKNR